LLKTRGVKEAAKEDIAALECIFFKCRGYDFGLTIYLTVLL